MSDLPEGVDVLVDFESKRELDSAACTVQDDNTTILLPRNPGMLPRLLLLSLCRPSGICSNRSCSEQPIPRRHLVRLYISLFYCLQCPFRQGMRCTHSLAHRQYFKRVGKFRVIFCHGQG